MRKAFKKFEILTFPPGSRRRRLVKKTLKFKKVTTIYSFKNWILKNEPHLFTSQPDPEYSPLISILVPCYNTPKKYIEPLINSVIKQKYTNWQLCLADGSTDSAKSDIISKLASKDKRIEYKKLDNNEGIVGNTNQALSYAQGEFVAFLDHDDVLSPYALPEVISVLNEKPETDLIYSDEDKISDDGKHRSTPFFKPDWSPELLLGVNYITHFVVARKSIVKKINGLRPGFDGSQDYDFLLRFTEQTDNIEHIPKLLYHWRLAEGSTAKGGGEKNYADTAGRKALADAVKRRNIDADVLEIPARPTNYRLQYKLPAKQPLVSIIIPFKDKADLLKTCVNSILSKTTYKNYEIILVSNNSVEKETHALLDRFAKERKCKIHHWNYPFNYSAVNNFGRSKANGEYLVLLNNDTEVLTDNWLEELIGVASQPQVGAVGPLLRYPNHTIQHAGVVLGMTGMAGHVFRHRQPEEWTDFGLACWPRNYIAVTGACLAIKAKKYDEVGGLDEKFIIAGNDVAIGISLYEKGYRNVYWPFAELMHYENVSVGSYSNVPIGDYNHSLEYYRPYLNWNDPYFNPNLDLTEESVQIRRSYDEKTT
jgi:glycosyltransferase involved in cell wall biosynthesis